MKISRFLATNINSPRSTKITRFVESNREWKIYNIFVKQLRVSIGEGRGGEGIDISKSRRITGEERSGNNLGVMSRAIRRVWPES